MYTNRPWTETELNKICPPIHAYVGGYNLNYMPIQDDDTIINHGDKRN